MNVANDVKSEPVPMTEAAQRLGFTTRMIHYLIATGELAPVHEGFRKRAVGISPDSLNRFMEKRQKERVTA